MQQKKIGDILYVFSIIPYEITEDTDAAVIKVQEECYKGYVEVNPSLADKFVKYNYHVLTVNEQEWAPYVEKQDPVSPELAWNPSGNCLVFVEDENSFPVLVNPHNVDVSFSSSSANASVDSETGAITLSNTGSATIRATHEADEDYEYQRVSYKLLINSHINPKAQTITVSQPVGHVIGEIKIGTSAGDSSLYDAQISNTDEFSYTAEIGQFVSIYYTDPAYVETVEVSGNDMNNLILDTTDPDHPYYYIQLNKGTNFSFSGGTPVVNHTFRLDGTGIHDHVTMKVNDETVSYTTPELVDGVSLEEGSIIDLYPTEDVSCYELTSGNMFWVSDNHWTATLDTDLAVEINYTPAPAGYTVSYTGDYWYEKLNDLVDAWLVGGNTTDTEGTLAAYDEVGRMTFNEGDILKVKARATNDQTKFAPKVDGTPMTYVSSQDSTFGYAYWYFAMPASNVQVSIEGINGNVLFEFEAQGVQTSNQFNVMTYDTTSSQWVTWLVQQSGSLNNYNYAFYAMEPGTIWAFDERSANPDWSISADITLVEDTTVQPMGGVNSKQWIAGNEDNKITINFGTSQA